MYVIIKGTIFFQRLGNFVSGKESWKSLLKVMEFCYYADRSFHTDLCFECDVTFYPK